MCQLAWPPLHLVIRDGCGISGVDRPRPHSFGGFFPSALSCHRSLATCAGYFCPFGLVVFSVPPFPLFSGLSSTSGENQANALARANPFDQSLFLSPLLSPTCAFPLSFPSPSNLGFRLCEIWNCSGRCFPDPVPRLP